MGRLRATWDLFDEIARVLDTEAGQVSVSLRRLEQALSSESL